jgi:RNA polymerase sigma-54 factor
MSVPDLQALLERIRQLDPFPGARFADEVARRVKPDLVVHCRDGVIDVLVNDCDLPSLGINEDYAAMARGAKVEGEVKRYLRPKLESARNLIYAVEQRRRTLARVGAAVMEHQRPFLERGKAAIRPLKMADVAELLGLHTSTVSRAVAGKYAQTAHGVFLLRDFFDGGRATSTRSADEARGRLGVQERVRQLIAAEQSSRPLSDDDLVALLAVAGIRVARRTVTKYRRELGIASSWRRRRYASDG